MAVGQDGLTWVALTGGHRLDRVGPTGSDTRQHRVVADRIGRAFEYRTTYAARRTWGDSWPYASQQQHTTGVGGVIGDSGGDSAGHFDGAHGAWCRRTRRCLHTCPEERWHR